MEAWEIEAREVIRDLVARYNACGDTAQIYSVVELFAPDGVLEIGPRDTPSVYAGRDAIRSLFAANRDQWASEASSGGRPHVVRHFVSTHEVTFDDARTARGRSHFLVLMAHGLDHWGRYFDDYAVVDGRWLFSERHIHIDPQPPPG